jgi:hypothetical protein
MLLFVSLVAAVRCATPVDSPQFDLLQALDHPVISKSVGEDKYKINNGFEGGLYTKTEDGVYHLFPSECMCSVVISYYVDV